jgi:hypothetical protein
MGRGYHPCTAVRAGGQLADPSLKGTESAVAANAFDDVMHAMMISE